jgi:hypothetical protein
MCAGHHVLSGYPLFVAPQAQGMCLGSRDVAHRLGSERTTAVWSPHASHKIWKKQCEATHTIGRRFGLKNALDYLVREKLLNFAEAAEQHAEFAVELPRFQAAAVWEVFIPMNSPVTWHRCGP